MTEYERKERDGQESLFCTDQIGNLAIKKEHRVNKKERPMLRTATEV